MKLARLRSQSRKYDPMLRLVALDLTVVMALVVSWNAGLLNPIWETDVAYMSTGIFAVFIVSQIWMAIRTWELCAFSHMWYPEDFELFESKIDTLGFVSEHLTTLGLIGTVLGFSIALNSAELLVDISSLPAMIASFMIGLGVALYTTLVGAAASVLLALQVRMLHSAYLTKEKIGEKANFTQEWFWNDPS